MRINKTLQGRSHAFESEEDQSPKTLLGPFCPEKVEGQFCFCYNMVKKVRAPDALLVDYDPALGLYAHSKPVIQGLKNKWTHECCNRSYREDGNRGR